MANNGISRRTMALLYMLAFAVVVGILIKYELISVLYVLVTLMLVTLLLIVGFADLENVQRADSEGTEA